MTLALVSLCVSCACLGAALMWLWLRRRDIDLAGGADRAWEAGYEAGLEVGREAEASRREGARRGEARWGQGEQWEHGDDRDRSWWEC